MKVNIWQIVADHLCTLRNNVTGKISIVDILLFFFVPIFAGVLVYFASVKASKDFYNVSMTFFGVFVALLLNFQVAAFGIYNRKRGLSEDEKLSKIQIAEIEIRRRLLGEINANISYLILVSVVAIVIFLFLYSVEETGQVAASLSWILYTHFILTLLMVVKRSHILFRKEYDEI